MSNSVKLLLIFGVFVGGVTALAVFSASPPSRQPAAPAVATERPASTSTPEVEATEPPEAQDGAAAPAAAEPAAATKRSTSDRGGSTEFTPDPGDFKEGEDAGDPFDGDAPYDDEDFPFDEEGETEP